MRYRALFRIGLAVGLGVLTAHAKNTGTAGQPAMMSQMQMMQACPMKTEGTTVAAADTTNGIAVTFTAKAEGVADLQNRVERMANMHNAMSSASGGPMQMIAGTVKYDALPTGARLSFTPQDASKLKEFRDQVRSRVEMMKKGDCSSMQGMMMQGMESPKAKTK